MTTNENNVKNSHDFRKNVLNDCLMSINCIMDTIELMQTTDLTVEDLEGKYAYLLEGKYYNHGMHRIVSYYEGLSLNDLYFFVESQKCISNMAMGLIETIVRKVNGEIDYEDKDACETLTTSALRLLYLVMDYTEVKADMYDHYSMIFSKYNKLIYPLSGCIEPIKTIKTFLSDYSE